MPICLKIVKLLKRLGQVNCFFVFVELNPHHQAKSHYHYVCPTSLKNTWIFLNPQAMPTFIFTIYLRIHESSTVWNPFNWLIYSTAQDLCRHSAPTKMDDESEHQHQQSQCALIHHHDSVLRSTPSGNKFRPSIGDKRRDGLCSYRWCRQQVWWEKHSGSTCEKTGCGVVMVSGNKRVW